MINNIIETNNMINIDRILVCIFHYNERTFELNKYCFQKLGFKNIKIFSSKTPFHTKLNQMYDYCFNEKDKYDLIIKSDADELVFSEIFKLIKEAYNYDLVLGQFFDKFMNKWRGSGPKIYNIKIIEYFKENNIKAKNILKPESNIFRIIKENGLKTKCFDIKTSLHEYEQYPSKVLNSLINRYHRNHLLNEYLYSEKFLINNYNHPQYKEVITYLYNEYIPNNSISSKKNCNYLNFKNFDYKFKEIKHEDITNLYNKYYLLFESKLNTKI